MRKHAQFGIDHRSGFFKSAHPLYDLAGHTLFANCKMYKGAGCLCPIIGIRGDLDFAHSITFNAHVLDFAKQMDRIALLLHEASKIP